MSLLTQGRKLTPL